MGMSAGQARLLSITAKLTDNELRSQILTNSKLRLADKSSEASEKYMNALNTQKLVYTNYDGAGNNVSQALTAGTLLSFGDMKNQYAMVNSSGQIYMSSDEIKTYESCATLTEYLHAHGIEDVDNPEYLNAVKEVYGNNYENFKNAEGGYTEYKANEIDNISKEVDGLLDDLNTGAVNLDGIDESTYTNLISGFSNALGNADLLAGEGGTPYGDFYNAVTTTPPAWMAKPTEVVPEHIELSDEAYSTLQTYTSNFTNKAYENIGSQHPTASEIEGMFYFLKSCLDSATVAGVSFIVSPTGGSGSVTGQSKPDYADDWNYIFTSYGNSQSVQSIQNKINELWVNSLIMLCGGLSKFKVQTDGSLVFPDPATTGGSGVDRINSITISKEAFEASHKTAGSTTALLDRTQMNTLWNEIKTEISNLPDTIKNEYVQKNAEAQNDADRQNRENNAQYENFKNSFKTWLENIQNTLETYKNSLLNLPSSLILDTTDSRYQWYKNLWYRMGGLSESEKQENGKCYKELDSSLMNNSEWIQFALEHGMITLEQAKFNENGSDKYPGMGTYDWSSIIYSSASDIVSQEDQVAIAKAEVEYENTVREIQNEDKKLDQDLKKLDTQHSALQTEYESIKSVIDKNVERSFKAFS